MGEYTSLAMGMGLATVVFLSTIAYMRAKEKREASHNSRPHAGR
jgi:hypothetical protein